MRSTRGRLSGRWAWLIGPAIWLAAGCGTATEPSSAADKSDGVQTDAGTDSEPSCAGAPLCPCSTDREGQVCEDGNLCTQGDRCEGGICTGGPLRLCPSTAPCYAGTCLPGTGKCQFHAAPDGYWCDDGDICTHTDRCKTGHCLGLALACDDGNPCTGGSCSAGTGCAHTALAITCDDGKPCTIQDACDAGKCGGLPINCDDGNGCTTDSCGATQGCQHKPALDGATCGKGLTCTAGACTNSCKPWGKVMGGKEADGFTSVTAHSDGGWTAVGWTGSKGSGEMDGWVVRFDAKWSIDLDQAMGGASEDQWEDVASLDDGGVLLAGWTASSGAGQTDGWATRLDAAGKVKWKSWHGGKGYDRLAAVQSTSGGGALLAGSRDVGGSAKGQAWLVKLTPAGQLLAEKSWGGEANDSFAAVAIAGVEVVAAGLTFTAGPQGDGAGLVVRSDANQKKVWELLIGGPKYETIRDMLYQTGGMFYAVGATNDTVTGDYDGLLAAFDDEGKLQWNKAFGTSSDERFEGVTVLGNGVVAVGFMDGGFGKADQGWVARLDNSGKLLWQQTAGGAGQDRLFGVARTWDSGVVAVGVSTVGGDNTDGWVTRLDAGGQMQCN